MRYLKLFENRDIEKICSEFRIKNYYINPDGIIDVVGNVDLQDRILDKIPVNFREVTGYFTCRNNNLKNLIGCPKRVGRMFDCSWNNLTSLEGCPNYIGGKFSCIGNKKLWSFDYFPRHAKVVYLGWTPIEKVFNLFSTVYLADGGEYFSTSGTMMDFFWDCDPVYPKKIIKKRRMNNFLHSIGKELGPEDIAILKNGGWEIED